LNGTFSQQASTLFLTVRFSLASTGLRAAASLLTSSRRQRSLRSLIHRFHQHMKTIGNLHNLPLDRRRQINGGPVCRGCHGSKTYQPLNPA
jgi:hypothetical protein